jgi:hypothetical protein
LWLPPPTERRLQSRAGQSPLFPKATRSPTTSVVWLLC